MIVIVWEAKDEAGEIRWHIGDTNPMDAHVCIDYVVEVQADGNEMIYIENRFLNLRKVKGAKQVRWLGEDARFIVANLVN